MNKPLNTAQLTRLVQQQKLAYQSLLSHVRAIRAKHKSRLSTAQKQIATTKRFDLRMRAMAREGVIVATIAELNEAIDSAEIFTKG